MNADKLSQLRELFETWLASRPSFRTTVEVQAAWEGWKANTAVAAMLAEHDAQPAQAAQPKTLAIFTANRAQALLDSFGGSPATYALIECKEGECAPLDDGSPSPAGLYVYDLNCPEEGVIYLGDEDEDSEPRSEQATQPEKPPFVLERCGFPVGSSLYRLERMPDGYWTPWHVAQQALMATRARMLYELDKVREQAAQPVGVTADLLRRIDVLCPSEGSYLSRMEWKAAKLNRMLAAAPQPPAQPNVIAPSVQTLPLKSAPYEVTTTAQPSADAEDAARYRWLRPRLLTADFEYGDDSETVLVFLIPTTMAVSANLDKSIDAARAAEGHGNG